MLKPLRHARLAVAALLVTVGLLITVPTIADAAAVPRLIVGFRPTTTTASQASTLAAAGLTARSSRDAVKGGIAQLHTAIVPVTRGTLAATRAKLLARPDVQYVEVDHVAHAYDLATEAATGVTAQWHPNDTFLTAQWGLAAIGAESAWELARGTGVTIAVVDTGVGYVHPDLKSRVDLGRDFVDNDDDPMDVQGHGTHVAGTAAGTADDAFGVAGVAPNSRILAVRVLDKDGAGNYSTVASGIVYAADKGAKVINLSLGGPDPSTALEEAINYATTRGAIVTCASGNEGTKTMGYPASYEGCTSVGATDDSDTRAPFSNVGPGLDLTAPGVQILSSTIGGGHEAWDGTSMATPFVSGTAALLYGQGLTRRDVLAAMTSTAHDLGPAGYDTSFGAGRIDAAAAVTAASRMPRAAADTIAPTIASVALTAPRRAVTTKVIVSWKVTKRTGWKRVGTTTDPSGYSWKKTSTRGAKRTTNTFRMTDGIVYRKSVIETRTKAPKKTAQAYLRIAVNASDDVAVDRVALEWGGRTHAVDWSAGDGWLLEAPCVAGARAATVRAYDAANNVVATDVALHVTC
ncbi:MAG: peptidase S8 [Thermoleophilia bacterium]|nr:peptidase S8 [Thermoleophilia bacterium]